MELVRRRKLVAAEPEAQKKALVAVYVEERGFKASDAKELVERISKYETPFAEELMQHCNGVAPPESEVGWLHNSCAIASVWLSSPTQHPFSCALAITLMQTM